MTFRSLSLLFFFLGVAASASVDIEANKKINDDDDHDILTNSRQQKTLTSTGGNRTRSSAVEDWHFSYESPLFVNRTSPSSGSSDLIPVRRYWNARLRDHYYTSSNSRQQNKNGGGDDGGNSRQENDMEIAGWRAQGVQCYVLGNRRPNTRRLFAFFSTGKGDHVLATGAKTDVNKKSDGESDVRKIEEEDKALFARMKATGYELVETVGWVPVSSKAEGAVPLYRYYNKGVNDHFYTDNWAHLKTGKNGYRLSGIEAYVYPDPYGGSTVISTADLTGVRSGDGNTGHSGNSALAKRFGLVVPLYRYWNVHYRDHFYTTRFGEVGDVSAKGGNSANGAGDSGWVYQGVQALVFASRSPGTVPLHRYWNVRTLDHLYTTNWKTLGHAGKDGWVYEGVACYVSPFRRSDTVPLYRYFNRRITDHLYTTKFLGQNAGGWKFEGIQAYVHPKPASGPSGAGGNIDDTPRLRRLRKAGLTPLYRYFNGLIKDHFYTSDFSILGSGVRGWKYDGESALVYAKPHEGAIALHRFWNPTTGDHFYTVDRTEIDGGLKGASAPSSSSSPSPWSYQGVSGYVFKTSDHAGTVPFYRYYNPSTGDHFYTTNWKELERGANGFEYQGIACYVVGTDGDGAVSREFVTARQSASASSSSSSSGEESDGIRENEARSDDSPIPIYRYFNSEEGDHMYTTTPVKSVGGWKYQGVQGFCYKKPRPAEANLYVPFYGYYNQRAKDHYYAVKWTGKRSDDWEYSGVICYVPSQKVDGTVPLFRYFNEKLHDHFYTTEWSDLKDGTAGYTYQGISAYIHPSLRPLPMTDGPGKMEAEAEKSKVGTLRRFYNAARKDHFYTTSTAVDGEGKDLKEEPGAGYVFLEPHAGAVPFYRYFNKYSNDHFYTTNWATLGKAGSDGWAYEGVQCYIYKSKLERGTIPLYRYFSETDKDHLYTQKYLGRERDGFKLQGIAGYVMESDPGVSTSSSSATVTIGNSALSVPLFRYYNKATRDHFYTTRKGVLDGGRQGWEYQGVTAYILKSNAAEGAIPLHVYFNTRVNDHFYTTDTGPLGKTGKYGWKYEGVEGFIFKHKAAGTVPLYRYYNDEAHDHFVTANWSVLGSAAGNKDGWKYQGVEGYVIRSPKAYAEARDAGARRARRRRRQRDAVDNENNGQPNVHIKGLFSGLPKVTRGSGSSGKRCVADAAGKICGGARRGLCDSKTGRCKCSVGFAGVTCSSRTCPKFKKNGLPCGGRARGTCDVSTGTCACKGSFLGPHCGYRKCPKFKGQECNGSGGRCDRLKGACKCSTGWTGKACHLRRCSHHKGKECNGQGTCNRKTAKCKCKGVWIGSKCHLRRCPRTSRGECNGTVSGKCNRNSGKCVCNAAKWHGVACGKRRCPKHGGKECSGGSHGTCNVNTGKCACKANVFTGSACHLRVCPIHRGKECGGRGSCNRRTGKCGCRSGAFGAKCHMLRCPKRGGRECGANGTCSRSTGKCKCQRGWFGKACGQSLIPTSMTVARNYRHGWRGAPCWTMRFPRRFRAHPKDLVPILGCTHRNWGHKWGHDRVACWTRRITRSSITVCTSEVNHHSHHDSNTRIEATVFVKSQSLVQTGTFLENSRPNIKRITCRNVNFKKRFRSTPVVVVSAGRNRNNRQSMDEAVTWLKRVSRTGFTACIRKYRGGGGHHGVTFEMNWIAMPQNYKDPRGYYQSGKTSLSGCGYIRHSSTIGRSGRPVILATTQSNGVSMVFGESGHGSYATVCVRNVWSDVYGWRGYHGRPTVHWIAVRWGPRVKDWDQTPKACPKHRGRTCSGRGACDASTGTCLCRGVWGGRACERKSSSFSSVTGYFRIAHNWRGRHCRWVNHGSVPGSGRKLEFVTATHRNWGRSGAHDPMQAWITHVRSNRMHICTADPDHHHDSNVRIDWLVVRVRPNSQIRGGVWNGHNRAHDRAHCGWVNYGKNYGRDPVVTTSVRFRNTGTHQESIVRLNRVHATRAHICYYWRTGGGRHYLDMPWMTVPRNYISKRKYYQAGFVTLRGHGHQTRCVYVNYRKRFRARATVMMTPESSSRWMYTWGEWGSNSQFRVCARPATHHWHGSVRIHWLATESNPSRKV